MESFAGYRINQQALEPSPVRIGELRPAILRLDRTPVRVFFGFFVHSRHVAALVLFEETLVRAEQRNEFSVLGWRRETFRLQFRID